MIYVMRPHKAFEVAFEESEIISSNSQFMIDGSGSFRELGNALRHFDKFMAFLLRPLNVDEINHSDSEVMAECQVV